MKENSTCLYWYVSFNIITSTKITSKNEQQSPTMYTVSQKNATHVFWIMRENVMDIFDTMHFLIN